MKRLTLLALAIGALMILPAGATDVLWSYGDFSQTIQKNRALDLYPVCVAATNSAGITAMDRITVKTGSDGTVITTGLMPGFCKADFHGVWVVTPRWFLIPNTTGLVYARDCILTNGLPPPLGAPTAFWGKAELVPGNNTAFRTNSGKVFIDTQAGGGSGTGGVSVAASAPLVAVTNNGLVTLSAPTMATASDVNAATQALGTALSAQIAAIPPLPAGLLTNGGNGPIVVSTDSQTNSYGYWTHSSGGSVSIGYNTFSSSLGVAIGNSAQGNDLGVGIGRSANGSTKGVSLGINAYSVSYGVAIGNNSLAPGMGNVAIGSGDSWGTYAQIPDGSGWTDTVEIGRGTASLQGGFNFHGYGVINSNGTIPCVVFSATNAPQAGYYLRVDVTGTNLYYSPN
jgi:hypothetical protein